MFFFFFQEMQRKVQEAENKLKEVAEHAQKTGRKLQVLMNAGNCKQSDPRPIPPNATTSTSQQTISAQRQLQWQQSSQGRNPPKLTFS